MAKRAPKVDHEKCIGCAVCYSVCPASPNVFEIKDGKAWVAHPEACTECESCVQNCPVQAITLVDVSEAGPKPS
ncbi:MAG: 4Fe-4S ferredoxin [Thermoprotei archaeon]|nr:MAG: 4Fe-4S ferredoxin [Thermoprotei archaeon]